MVNLNECNGIRNTLYDTSSRIFVPNKTEDVNLNVLNVFNMIPRINGPKTSKELFHVTVNVNLIVPNINQIKIGIKINVHNATVKIQQNIVYVERIAFGIQVHVLFSLINIQKIMLI